MESARCPPPKVPSPTTSAASKGEKRPAPSNNIETSTPKPSVEVAEITSAPKVSEEIVKVDKPVDASESLNGKEAVVSQVNTQAPKEETQQQAVPGDQGSNWLSFIYDKEEKELLMKLCALIFGD